MIVFLKEISPIYALIESLDSESQISFSLHYHMHWSSTPTTKWIWSQEQGCEGESNNEFAAHTTLQQYTYSEKNTANVFCSIHRVMSTTDSGTNGKFQGHSVIRAYPHSSNTHNTISKVRILPCPILYLCVPERHVHSNPHENQWYLHQIDSGCI